MIFFFKLVKAPCAEDQEADQDKAEQEEGKQKEAEQEEAEQEDAKEEEAEEEENAEKEVDDGVPKSIVSIIITYSSVCFLVFTEAITA